jgi:hypothetical protein
MCVETVAEILLYEARARVASAEYDVLFEARRNVFGHGLSTDVQRGRVRRGGDFRTCAALPRRHSPGGHKR